MCVTVIGWDVLQCDRRVFQWNRLSDDRLKCVVQHGRLKYVYQCDRVRCVLQCDRRRFVLQCDRRDHLLLLHLLPPPGVRHLPLELLQVGVLVDTLSLHRTLTWWQAHRKTFSWHSGEAFALCRRSREPILQTPPHTSDSETGIVVANFSIDTSAIMPAQC